MTLLCLLVLASTSAQVHARPRGTHACERALHRIAKRSTKGQSSCVVFDVDNTLVDARGRTREALNRFARKHRLPHLVNRPLREMGFDGVETARRLQLPRALRPAFAEYWHTFFWSPENVKFDPAIAKTVKLARAAKEAGAEVYYLTGRTHYLHEATRSRLMELGLPDLDQAHHLITKPRIGVPTTGFKVEAIAKLAKRFDHVGFSLTDAPYEAAAIGQNLPAVRSIWLDFAILPPGARAPSQEIPSIIVRP
jgi:hypothetical protein